MDKNVAFTMYSTCYQLKIDSYTYRLLYMSSMVTINKKKMVDAQKIVRKILSTALQKVIKPQRKKPKEEERKKEEIPNR